MKTTKPCSNGTCGTVAYAGGLCKGCYTFRYRNGLLPSAKHLEDRITRRESVRYEDMKPYYELGDEPSDAGRLLYRVFVEDVAVLTKTPPSEMWDWLLQLRYANKKGAYLESLQVPESACGKYRWDVWDKAIEFGMTNAEAEDSVAAFARTGGELNAFLAQRVAECIAARGAVAASAPA